MSINNMVLPKIEPDATTRSYGRFIVSPLERGFGTTIGNALRRILLSSLEGAAITSLRVTGVPHEFSAIPDVKEDMTQLILQVKKLRLKLLGEESARLYLNKRGPAQVLAVDLQVPPSVEIINPDLFLFTIDTPSATVEMEFKVESGRGHSPADDRTRLPIGEVPVDAIFSPIRRVNFEVERARVGQKTNYDRLVLEIWTDGTITPEEAMSQAAKIMMEHLAIIAGVQITDYAVTGASMPPVAEEGSKRGPAPEFYEIPIEQLDLSVRVFNSLKRTGITTVGEVLEMLERGTDAMLAIRNFGEKSLEELTTLLREKGFLAKEESDS